MNWKSELVSSTDEGFDFLERQLASKDLPTLYLSKDVDQPDVVTIEAKDVSESVSEEDTQIFYFSVSVAKRSSCVVDFFSVSPLYQRNGLGALAAKTMLGIASVFSPCSIKIPNVIEQEIGFWLYFGAVPENSPSLALGNVWMLHDHVHDELNNRKLGLTYMDRKCFWSIFSIAEQNPYLGLRALSQVTNFSPQGEESRQKIFMRICYEKDLVLLPSEISTREILMQRIGVLPSFPPLSKHSPYASIARALCQGKWIGGTHRLSLSAPLNNG